MVRNQCKKDEISKNQNASSPPRDHNLSPAREQNWMENEFDELTEAGFRRFTKVEMKEKMLRAAREKGRVTHKGKPIRLTADLSAETLQARREWGPIFNILKERNFQPRISYPAKLSFISEGETKSFMDEQLLRDFVPPGLPYKSS
ncbi:LINE-1 retrotransposable element ORF1 protein [Plecturocebus cupreus]